MNFLDRCGFFTFLTALFTGVASLGGLFLLPGEQNNANLGPVPPVVSTAEVSDSSSFAQQINSTPTLLPGVLLVDKCAVDVRANINTCLTIPAISFIESAPGGQFVMKINLDTPGVRYDSVAFDIFYESASPRAGWTVNIGDSATNDGYGGDAATQSNDAEIQVLNGVLDIYQAVDGAPGAAPIVVLDGNQLITPLLTLEVANGSVRWATGNTSGAIQSERLFAFNGQPDSEGPVNYDLYAAFNRTIGDRSRTGSGVFRVIVRLTRSALSDPNVPTIEATVDFPTAEPAFPPTATSTPTPVVSPSHTPTTNVIPPTSTLAPPAATFTSTPTPAAVSFAGNPLPLVQIITDPSGISFMIPAGWTVETDNSLEGTQFFIQTGNDADFMLLIAPLTAEQIELLFLIDERIDHSPASLLEGLKPQLIEDTVILQDVSDYQAGSYRGANMILEASDGTIQQVVLLNLTEEIYVLSLAGGTRDSFGRVAATEREILGILTYTPGISPTPTAGATFAPGSNLGTAIVNAPPELGQVGVFTEPRFDAPLAGTLVNGTTVEVLELTSSLARVRTLDGAIEGWVLLTYLNYQPPANLPTPTPFVTPTPFITPTTAPTLEPGVTPTIPRI